MDPNTVNIALATPTRGSDTGTWDLPLNGNSAAIDGFTGGVQPISVSNANIVLTAPSGSITPSGGPTQAQNKALKIVGALTGNVQITLPLPGDMIIHNLTTGAFVVTFAAAASGQVIGIEQGSVQRIYNDGTNVYFVGLEDVGTYRDICDATVPAWITACTVPPFLNCAGGTFNAATYPYLNAKLGSNTLPDFRGVAPGYLNQGTGRITAGGSGINGDARFSIGGVETVTLSLGQIPSHNHGVNDPSHSHAIWSILSAITNGTIAGVPSPTYVSNSQGNNSGASFTGISIQAAGGGGAHTNMPPTTIGGLRLIRAA
jgi:microcystin-dependent protein